MHELTLDASTRTIRRLRTHMDGRIIEPDHPAYDAARAVYFTGFDRRPVAIARVADAHDVARVVVHARDAGLELAVRSGGHSMVGHGTTDGGILIDLSAMKAIEIDPGARTAWAQAGVTAGEYTRQAAQHGLVTGFGDAPSVGLSGITLAGGVGFLHRKLGLTIDQLLAAEVVTADGSIVHADAHTNPDLFWALRGGGGNFGVVTRLKYQLHPIDTVVGGMLMLPATPDVIEAAVAEALAAPEELSGMLNIMPAPPMPFIPAEYHGRLVVMAMMVYSGQVEEAERVYAPFRALATPLADMIRPIPYPAMYEGHEGAPHPTAVAGRNFFLDAVERAGAHAIVEGLQASTAPMRVVQFRVLGGAVARVPADATAFAHRGRAMMANVGAMYQKPEERATHRAWADGLADTLRTGAPGAYVGFVSEESPTRVREAYPEATYQRLARIKRRYDPDNLFRLNQNVPPAV